MHTILLVQPDPLLGRAMTRLLAVMGHRVTTPEQAEDHAVLKDVACVIVDEQDQDDVPTAASALPRIILTSEPLPARWHIKAILRKPFSAEELRVAILQACLPPRLQHVGSAEWEISRSPNLPAT